MQYQPPSPDDLARLKDELGLSSAQMARLFGLSGGRHWRKYTGGGDPQGISPLPLFFAMAQLELDNETIERVLQRMRRVGATIDLSADSPELDGEQQP
ncbi:XRE family transcriptional regulator [Paraburkholderia aromaticivorans]|uniref:XRE family transcriptional regulator n=1 Tax=Paraburkholderia aromaticivorans TaxID=2026199 RepID=UPI00145623B8|nr:XRE family transcriptional regulator [Paraburkholderia aromaticivorans]